MKSKIFFLLILLLSCKAIAAQDKPVLSRVDRIRLAEAFRLADNVSEKVWQDWTKAPFAVLLVTPDYEFLLRHPSPSADFLPLGYDSLLKTDVYYRKRVFSTQLLATFPAIKGSMISTIVVGQAERTSAKTSTPWVITLLHEHFHQLQNSQPNYYSEVEALKLSRGDQTGMWMLNFPFPYEKKEVQQGFRKLSTMLADAIEAQKADQARSITTYLRTRREFEKLLTPDEERYFAFQLWQEGVARYTEYQVAKLANANFKVSKRFRALPDYTSFAQTADSIYENIFKQLQRQRLDESKREVVYPFGAAEALLLDRVSPHWKSRYFVDRFDLGKYYPTRLQRI